MAQTALMEAIELIEKERDMNACEDTYLTLDRVVNKLKALLPKEKEQFDLIYHNGSENTGIDRELFIDFETYYKEKYGNGDKG